MFPLIITLANSMGWQFYLGFIKSWSVGSRSGMDAVTEMAMTLSLSLASPMWALRTQDSSMVRVAR